jgi:hypothetical protein
MKGLGSGDNEGLIGSFPSDSTGAPLQAGDTNPRYWTVTIRGDNEVRAFALCVPN